MPGENIEILYTIHVGGWVPLLAGNLNRVGWLHANEKGEELAVIPGEIHNDKTSRTSISSRMT